MKNLYSAAIVLIFFGCDPVRYVLASPEKTRQVAVEYFKNFPGDTCATLIAMRDVIIYQDSIINAKLTDSVRMKKQLKKQGLFIAGLVSAIGAIGTFLILRKIDR